MGLTEDPEESGDKGKNGMPVCMLHGLERNREGVLHRLNISDGRMCRLQVDDVFFRSIFTFTNGQAHTAHSPVHLDNTRQGESMPLLPPTMLVIRLNPTQSRVYLEKKKL